MSTQKVLLNSILEKSVEFGFERANDTLVTHHESHIFALKIERGKYPQIPEFRITFSKYDAADKWATTSPNSESSEYIMPFRLQKRLHCLSKETDAVKEKTSLVYWLFSPNKDWFYITNEAQLKFVGVSCIDSILKQYSAFIKR